MDTNSIKTAIEDFLKKMTVKVDRIDIVENDNNYRFLIQSSDAPILIGRKGEHFTALNHLIRKVILKDKPENFKFSIDINGYQEENLNTIKNKAKIVAERVKSFKTEMEMDPMSSYERMAVHTLLENDPHIKTESRGEGKERRVVIKYVDISFKNETI